MSCAHRQQFDTVLACELFHVRGSRRRVRRSASECEMRPAREKLFSGREGLRADDLCQPKPSRLRRHDLRACSWWLRAGADADVCQRWSGHRRLSELPDIYQGVAPGREDKAIERLDESLAVAA
jgi:integrase